MPTITIDNLGQTVAALPGQSLLSSLLHEGQPIHTRCGGRARCGCCRVRVLAGARGTSPPRPQEVARLGEAAMADGWRLACQTYILRDLTIFLPSAEELDSACSSRPKAG